MPGNNTQSADPYRPMETDADRPSREVTTHARVPGHVWLGQTLLCLLIAVVTGWGTTVVLIEVWPYKNGSLLFAGIAISFAFGSLLLRDRLLRWYSDNAIEQERTHE